MRKTVLLSIAGTLALGLAVPGLAQQPGPRADQSAQANGAADADPNRVICARADIESGTRISRRVCRTAREWQEDGGIPTSR